MQGYIKKFPTTGTKNHLPPYSRRPHHDDGSSPTSCDRIFTVVKEIVRIAIAVACFAIYQRYSTQNAASQTPTGLDMVQSITIGSHRFVLPSAYDRDFWLVPSPPNQKSNRTEIPVVKLEHKNVSIYGGNNEGHLGGFTVKDIAGISENVWNFMMGILGIHSLLDIGCGRGHSSHYFLSKKARVLCIEGSVDAVKNSVLPLDRVVEHDFSLGPWWPTATFDACWAVEFLEHVSRHYAKNYIQAFRKCALLFVTRSPWGGHHHVEVHAEWWWIARLQSAGFIYDKGLSSRIQSEAFNEWSNFGRNVEPGNKTHVGQHIRGMMVFHNPVISSLQQHAHLFAGYGCYNEEYENQEGGAPCTDPNDKIPLSYQPLLNCIKTLTPNDIKAKTKLDEIIWNCTQNS